MSGLVLVGLLLITGGIPVPAVVTAPEAGEARLSTVDVGGGVAVGTGGTGLSSLVVLDFEKPVFVSQAFFVDFTLKADWRNQGSQTSFLNRFDALAGLRLGVKLGSAFELFFGFAAGAAGAWSRTSTTFQGWWMSDQFGVGFQAGVGARIHLGDRISILLVPAELLGSFWPLGGLTGNAVAADFTAYVGLGVAL